MVAPDASRTRAGAGFFRPVLTRSAARDVLEQIVDLIRGGQLREGDELPAERTIAARPQPPALERLRRELA
jgi:hypothetical protein